MAVNVNISPAIRNRKVSINVLFLTLSVAEVVAAAERDGVVVVVDFRGVQADRRVSAVGQLGAAVVEDVLEAEGELAHLVHVLGCVER